MSMMQEVLEKLRHFSERLPARIRLAITRRTTANFTARDLDAADEELAVEIFRLLAHDVELQVRKLLAQNLKDDPKFPHDVALQLACDVAEVADPVLEHSAVLSDDELMAIVQVTKSLSSRLAVARRKRISAPLTQVLIETGQREVAVTVACNPGAAVNDNVLLAAAGAFPDAEDVMVNLIHRHKLRLPVAEALIGMVSDKVRRQIMTQAGVAPILLEEAALATEEWTQLRLLHNAPPEEVLKYVAYLHIENKLTPSLLIRALCNGDLRFFEAAVARRAQVPLRTVRKMLHEQGALGFRTMYKAADMPHSLRHAVHVLFKLAAAVQKQGRLSSAEFANRVLASIRANGYDQSVENMSYITAIIGRNLSMRNVKVTVAA